MALIDRTGFIADRWQRDDTHGPDAIVPHADASATTRAVSIENTASVDDVVARLPELDLLSIEFPATGDGRGFSLARRLRRLGFAGELRAHGPLIADQFAFALQCGFDTVEIPGEMAARQPEAQWLAALDHIERNYQHGYAKGSILERRHAPVAGFTHRQPEAALAA